MRRMGILLRVFSTIPLLAGLVACSTFVGSQRLDLGSPNQTTGVEYRLPRALLPVHLLRDKEGNVAIQIDEPRYTGDPEQTYLLNYAASALSRDTLGAQVDPVSRLLKKIEMKADDQLDEIVVEVARSAVALLESGVIREDFETLLSVELDPADSNAVEALSNLIKGATKDGAAEDVVRVSKVEIFEIVAPTLAADDEKLCSVGVCYRAPVPYTIKYKFSDGRFFEREVLLPNGGPIVSIALTRAPFVEKIHNITFVNGLPAQISIEKPSEALEVAKLPLEVIGAVFETVGDLIKFRIDTTGGEKALADQEVALIEARQKLRDAKSEQAQALESSRLEPLRVLMFGASGGFTPRPSSIQQTKSPDRSAEPNRGRAGGFGEVEER